MAGQIDPTKPVDGEPAVKADLRASLQAAKDEIEALQSGKAEVVHSHALTDLQASGTPDETTFLRDDGSWASPSGGSQISAVAYRTVDVGGDRPLGAADKSFVVEGGDMLVVQQLLVRHGRTWTPAARRSTTLLSPRTTSPAITPSCPPIAAA